MHCVLNKPPHFDPRRFGWPKRLLINTKEHASNRPPGIGQHNSGGHAHVWIFLASAIVSHP